MNVPNDQQTMETMTRISTWLLQKLKGTISEADNTALTTWLQQRSDTERAFIDKAVKEEEIAAALRYMYGVNEEEDLAAVMNTLQLPVVQEVPVIPMQPKPKGRSLYKLAAAAVVSGVLITAAVLITRKGQPAAGTKEIAQVSDIQPGGDKAILTLSNGKKIILDSVHNGGITQDGDVAINKQDGTVYYQPANEEAGSIQHPLVYNTLSTPRGGQFNLVLPDGSKVWLNAASSVKYPTAFTGDTREVEITGEAYFEVHKDASKPFRVMIAATATRQASTVEVLGTHFNVNAYADEASVNTTLLEGKVKVTGNHPVILQPGEQAQMTHEGNIKVLPKVDLEEAIAWKNGLFQFQAASITGIMRQVARWYDVEVEFNGNIDNQFVGKIPRRVSLANLLKILESTGLAHFRIEGNKVIVSP